MTTKVVALVGNGLSTLCNPKMAGKELAAQLNRDFTSKGVNLTRELEHLGRFLREEDPQENFDALLGPIDRLALVLESLTELDVLKLSKAGRGAIRGAKKQVRNIYSSGVGFALNRIAIEAKPATCRLDEHGKFLRKICGPPLEKNDTVNLYTLNYDTLLETQLAEMVNEDLISLIAQIPIRKKQIADLRIFPSGPPLKATMLREPGVREWGQNGLARVHLYHLHGSLQWVRKKIERNKNKLGDVFQIDDLDELLSREFFVEYATKDLPYEPVVVLTDRKGDEIIKPPFSSAYDSFNTDLGKSTRIMIAGYSFGDAQVNRYLRNNLGGMETENLPEEIIVLTKSLRKSEVEKEKILDYLRPEHDERREQIATRLTVYTSGISKYLNA